MPRGVARAQPCGRPEAMARLAQAEALVGVAELVLDDASDVATPGVAAALAVLAGIAASDAACCTKLKQRSRGRSHDEAVALLAGVRPHGRDMSRDLQRLLGRKDASHYGVAFVSLAEAQKMVAWAQRLTATARVVVES